MYEINKTHSTEMIACQKFIVYMSNIGTIGKQCRITITNMWILTIKDRPSVVMGIKSKANMPISL